MPKAQYFAQPIGQLVHWVSQSTLPERAKRRQIFSDLRGSGPEQVREFVTRGGLLPAAVQILQVAEVHRQAANGGIGYTLHDRHWLVKFFTKLRRFPVIY